MARLSRKQVERLIRERAADTGNVLLTDHARKRMKERRITLAMVYEVLRRGLLNREPEPNLRYVTLECRRV